MPSANAEDARLTARASPRILSHDHDEAIRPPTGASGRERCACENKCKTEWLDAGWICPGLATAEPNQPPRKAVPFTHTDIHSARMVMSLIPTLWPGTIFTGRSRATRAPRPMWLVALTQPPRYGCRRSKLLTTARPVSKTPTEIFSMNTYSASTKESSHV